MSPIFSNFAPEEEKRKIVAFLRATFEKQHISNAVIGLSGGIDSSVSFFLLKEILPPEHLFVTHLYYDTPVFASIEECVHAANIPPQNIHLISIKDAVDVTAKLLGITESDKVRKGNLMARTRMIVLFDLAKKYNALVCGTENRSENLLGYFTRFGDQASDLEPIEHLYKTEVIALAKYLGVPDTIIDQNPTAGLWEGQTDEAEMGFTYKEADIVLNLYFDKRLSIDKIKSQGYENAEKIIKRHKQNRFKHEAPYRL
jgi:NAD+ synthase